MPPKSPSKRRVNPIAVADDDPEDLDPIAAEPAPADDVFSLLDRVEDHKFRLWRLDATGQRAYVAEYVGQFDLDAVRQQHGGGRYIVQRVTMSNTYAGQRSFMVAGSPATSTPATPVPGAAPPGEVAELRAMVTDLRAQLERSRDSVSVRELLPLLTQQRPDNTMELLKVFLPIAFRREPIGELLGAVKAMDDMRGGPPEGGAAAASATSEIAAMMQAFPALAAGMKELGWAEPRPQQQQNPVMMTARGSPPAAPRITAPGPSADGPPPGATAVAPPAPPVTPAPAGPPGQTAITPPHPVPQNVAEAMIAQVGVILTGAVTADEADPDSYINVISDLVTAAAAPIGDLLDAHSDDELVERLCAANPVLSVRPERIGPIVAGLREAFAAVDDGDEEPAATEVAGKIGGGS